MGKYDKKSQKSSGGASAAPRGNATQQLSGNPELETIARWLASVKFKKKALGGYDPLDVWKKIEELNALYEDALVSERVRYNMLLRQIRAQQAVSDPTEDENGQA